MCFSYTMLELGNISSSKLKGFQSSLSFINCSKLQVRLCNQFQGMSIIRIFPSPGLSHPSYYFFFKWRPIYTVNLSGIPHPIDNYVHNKQQLYFLCLIPLQPAGLSSLVLDIVNSNYKLNSVEQQLLLVPALNMTHLRYHPSHGNLVNLINILSSVVSHVCPNTTINTQVLWHSWVPISIKSQMPLLAQTFILGLQALFDLSVNHNGKTWC